MIFINIIIIKYKKNIFNPKKILKQSIWKRKFKIKKLMNLKLIIKKMLLIRVININLNHNMNSKIKKVKRK